MCRPPGIHRKRPMVLITSAGGLVAHDVRRATDAMRLQATVQGRAGHRRDGGLKGTVAIVQRQKGMPAERRR